MNSEDLKTNYELLYESDNNNENIDTLFNLIKTDRISASIYYNDNKYGYLFKIKIVKFYNEDGSFTYMVYNRSYNVSKNHKMYTKDTTIIKVRCSSKGFYVIKNKGLQQFKLNNLFVIENKLMMLLINDMSNDFSWVKFLYEKNLFNITLNTVINNKLYSYEKVLKHIFKIPYKKCLLIIDSFSNGRRVWNHDNPYSFWKFLKNNLVNPENINLDFIENQYSHDLVNMSKILNVKVNCNWSYNRIKLEHDKLSDLITKKKLIYIKDESLNIANIFYDFEVFSGFKLLKTNKDMVNEGLKLSHCVATYIDKVNTSNVAVFNIDYEYTLELYYEHNNKKTVNFFSDHYIDLINLISGDNKSKICKSQLRGYNNITPPEHIANMVDLTIQQFNNTYNFDENLVKKQKDSIDKLLMINNDYLPF